MRHGLGALIALRLAVWCMLGGIERHAPDAAHAQWSRALLPAQSLAPHWICRGGGTGSGLSLCSTWCAHIVARTSRAQLGPSMAHHALRVGCREGWVRQSCCCVPGRFARNREIETDSRVRDPAEDCVRATVPFGLELCHFRSVPCALLVAPQSGRWSRR